MATLENVFSWSKSRDAEFRECRRKYFYSRYASWGGWDRNAPREARLAYVLKNLKNRWTWKGEAVHHLIEDVLKALRAGRPMTLKAALERLTEVMRRDFRSSKTKKYLEDPKNSVGLFEHEYDKGVSDAVWQKVHEEASVCVRNFYRSAFFAELTRDDKKNWLVIEDLEEFDFEGAKIYVKLDFARRKGGLIEIYDWKTGKNDGDASVQMGAYAIYAMGEWKAPLENLRAFLFNVAREGASPENYPLSAALIDRTRAAITESVRAMRELLEEPAKNVPKAREQFPFTDDAKVCSTCSFYRICEKYAPGS